MGTKEEIARQFGQAIDALLAGAGRKLLERAQKSRLVSSGAGWRIREKKSADDAAVTSETMRAYCDDVRAGAFPDAPKYCYNMIAGEKSNFL